METVTKNQGGALPSAKKVVTTPINKVPSDDLKVSSEAISFRNGKAGSQPCLSFMPAVSGRMRRCEDPRPAPQQETGTDRMSESVRRFRESLMYSVPSIVREQAVDTLSLLIRFDSAISMDDSKILQEAVKVINKAGVAHT